MWVFPIAEHTILETLPADFRIVKTFDEFCIVKSFDDFRFKKTFDEFVKTFDDKKRSDLGALQQIDKPHKNRDSHIFLSGTPV